jgi:hypothetical protein
MRPVPTSAPLSPCPPDYARPLIQGLDSVQEALDLSPSDQFCALLKSSQEAAKALRTNDEGMVTISLGPETFNAHATGAKGGFRWRLDNDDFMLLIGSPLREWTISVRYLSAGLWEHGLEALRARAFEALRPYTKQLDHDCIRVSRADYCFDFYSPAFTKEFVPGLARALVCHSSTKAEERGSYGIWARGGHGETLTAGSKSAQQVQLYNKTLEIDEASGKTWLYALWVMALDGEWPWPTERPSDVWRLECRWMGKFLKERNIRRPHEFKASLPDLIAESLYTRRLGVPPVETCAHCGSEKITDENRWRWPVHPIWSEAIRLRASESMVPVGRMVTGRRAALVDRAQAALAGSLHSLVVLKHKGFREDRVFPEFQKIYLRMRDDPNFLKKDALALARYRKVDDAR